jgi:cyclohexadienyl dehydratase
MKIRKCSISLCVSLIAFVLAISSASAQQPSTRLDEIIQRGILRVGMTGDYKPFAYFDRSTEKFTGLDVDMAESLGKALGVKVEYVHTAWPQLMKDFESDKFDVAMGGVSITLDRQRKGYFSMPIMREGKTPIARCGDVGKYQTLADIDKPWHARHYQSRRHQRALRAGAYQGRRDQGLWR